MRSINHVSSGSAWRSRVRRQQESCLYCVP
jgi:hypothetical protein